MNDTKHGDLMNDTENVGHDTEYWYFISLGLLVGSFLGIFVMIPTSA